MLIRVGIAGGEVFLSIHLACSLFLLYGEMSICLGGLEMAVGHLI